MSIMKGREGSQDPVMVSVYMCVYAYCFNTDLNLSFNLVHVGCNTLASFSRLIFWHSFPLLQIQTSTCVFRTVQRPEDDEVIRIQNCSPCCHAVRWLCDRFDSRVTHSLVCAGFESWVEVERRPLAVSYSLQWHVYLFVETRVSSSGETWQAKLIEIVIISVAQGCAAVVCGGCRPAPVTFIISLTDK